MNPYLRPVVEKGHAETPGALDRSGNWVCEPQFGFGSGAET